MNSTYSRREFLNRSLAVGAGAAAIQLFPVGAAAAAAVPGHPLTRAHDPAVLLRWFPAVHGAVKRERFTPTNAARIYAYFSVAAYEAVIGGMPRHRSLGRQLNDLPRLPTATPSRRYDWPTAANAAMATIAPALFADRAESLAELAALESAFRAERAVAVADGPTINRSVAHGRAVGDAIVNWIHADGWADIQGLAYTPPVGPGLWQSTPPNFGTAIEPYWEQVRTFALYPVTECTPPPPVAFSTEPASEFYAQAMATYNAVLNLTDTQKDTAFFWRDNPDGTTGLPSGHWALIACVLIGQLGHNLEQAAELLALNSISVADAFSSCWTEKFRTNLIRPVTYIQQNIDPTFTTPVNTPQFPEYTSGHSVGSGAAAATLTALVGTVAFVDNTGEVNGFPARSFASIWDAANEAAISRLYGGIHYPMGIEAGIEQGKCVSQEVLGRISTRKNGAIG